MSSKLNKLRELVADLTNESNKTEFKSELSGLKLSNDIRISFASKGALQPDKEAAFNTI